MAAKYILLEKLIVVQLVKTFIFWNPKVNYSSHMP
jgi:hypothetical protein